MEHGRCTYEGAQRGWGLEFGTLFEDVFRDPLYRRARRFSRGRSALSEFRRMNIFLILRFFMRHLAGQDVIELGVWRGGNVFFMAAVLKELYPSARIVGLDTFEGMPETKLGLDLHRGGDFSDASLQGVQDAARRFGLDNVEFIKGDVRQTLDQIDPSRQFGLAHIDLDIYEPIAYAQRALLERLVPGGYLTYDDAVTSSCPGATQAVEELIASGMRSEQIFPHFVFRAQPAR
jgi:hypothetical protein